MDWLNPAHWTDSVVGIIGIVVFMLAAATIGIGIMAAVFSGLLQATFNTLGDRDSEAIEASEGGES